MSINLDLTGVTEQSPNVPDGIYNVGVVHAEVKPTQSGGEMIKVQLKITDGPQENRVIFDQFNIKNSNPMAVQIGLSQLKGMMKAFGHKNPNALTSVQELVGLKGVVKAKIEESNGYTQTRVKAYQTTATQTAAATDTKSPF